MKRQTVEEVFGKVPPQPPVAGNCCRNCKHARFQLGPGGGIRTRVHGVCAFPIPQPSPLSSAITIQIDRRAIWPNSGTNCPTWRANLS